MQLLYWPINPEKLLAQAATLIGFPKYENTIIYESGKRDCYEHFSRNSIPLTKAATNDNSITNFLNLSVRRDHFVPVAYFKDFTDKAGKLHQVNKKYWRHSYIYTQQ